MNSRFHIERLERNPTVKLLHSSIYVLNISALITLGFTLSRQSDCLASEKAQPKTITAVCALRDIPNGATIGIGDVAETKVPSTRIPISIHSSECAKFGSDPTFYLTSTKDAFGRLSKGIGKGQILFFSYPGFRGPTIIMAVKNIPARKSIRIDSVVEREVDPRDIPNEASSFKTEVVGRLSAGIFKGQAVTLTSPKDGKPRCGGEFLSPSAGVATHIYFYAVKKIAPGHDITADDVKRRISTLLTGRRQKENDNFSMHPEGRNAKRWIDIGQVIRDEDLSP